MGNIKFLLWYLRIYKQRKNKLDIFLILIHGFICTKLKKKKKKKKVFDMKQSF